MSTGNILNMFAGAKNKKIIILVINMPTFHCSYFYVVRGEDTRKEVNCLSFESWTTIDSCFEQTRRFPHLSEWVIDSFAEPKAWIWIVPWDRFSPQRGKYIVDAIFEGRRFCE